jgi:hypothetical protein
MSTHLTRYLGPSFLRKRDFEMTDLEISKALALAIEELK